MRELYRVLRRLLGYIKPHRWTIVAGSLLALVSAAAGGVVAWLVKPVMDDIFLKHDRAGTLEQMRRVMHNFAMPAIAALAEGRPRVAAVNALEIMSEDIYYADVYLPILAELNVHRSEMRNRVPVRKSAPTA